VVAGQALLASLPAAADQMTAANGSATNEARFALADTVDGIPLDGWDAFTAQMVVTDYVAAVHALQESQAAEEAEKAGDLYDERVAVEAFARSIAGGVPLDFDWAPVVNGYGAEPGSYGGTAYWRTGRGGYATITLSDGVAADWGEPSPLAVVVHEVGHSIGARCSDLQAQLVGEDYEAWATAWTIGMGYTADGNGESPYSRPSDEIIAGTTQCR